MNVTRTIMKSCVMVLELGGHKSVMGNRLCLFFSLHFVATEYLLS